jgi:hypothetical protein
MPRQTSFSEVRTSLLKLTCLATLVATLCLTSAPQIANAKPPLGRRWSASQRVSITRIDHTAFDQLLKKYVDSDGYLNYAAWQRSSRDRSALQRYLGDLSRADTRAKTSKNARLAFWINAYNALTIEGMLQVYPTSSIRNHTASTRFCARWASRESIPDRVCFRRLPTFAQRSLHGQTSAGATGSQHARLLQSASELPRRFVQSDGLFELDSRLVQRGFWKFASEAVGGLEPLPSEGCPENRVQRWCSHRLSQERLKHQRPGAQAKTHRQALATVAVRVSGYSRPAIAWIPRGFPLKDPSIR